MSELWFKCQDYGSNVRIVVQMLELWFRAISGLGWVGIGMGWDLCEGLFYEHRFAMLIMVCIIGYNWSQERLTKPFRCAI